MERERKVDIEKIDLNRVDEISDQIGEKVKIIVDKSIEDVNRILKIYGMKAVMQIAIEEIKENK